MLEFSPQDKILVIAPHPDDESLGVGGLMISHAKQIDSFCFLSSGIAPNAEEKSNTRISEWNATQAYIGCHNLGIIALYGEKPLLPRIADNMDEYLKRLKTSQYDYIFMPHLKDNHPEHQYISGTIMRQILLNNGYKKNLKIVFYEVWRPLNDPNQFFAIDSARKLELLSLYKTQWGICNLPQKIIGLNCYRGVDAGFKEYVEAFKMVDIEEYLTSTHPIEEITENKDKILQERLYPNFISNRFDLLYGHDYELYDLGMGVVPVKIEGNIAILGMSLSNYPDETLQKFYDLLFAKHPTLEFLQIKHSLSPYGISPQGNQFYHYPYWHISLPQSQEEFDKTLASLVRYNTKWYPKKIREDIGDIDIKRLSVTNTADEIVEKFFEWKKESHDCNYNMTAKEYLKTYGVTETYAMYIDKELVGVGFTCTTGNNVYFKQFSYSNDKKYKKYSLGTVLYYAIICDLITLKRNNFYLSGGWLDYKRRYNGICQYTYSGIISKKHKKKKKHHSFWWHLRHLKF